MVAKHRNLEFNVRKEFNHKMPTNRTCKKPLSPQGIEREYR